MYVGCSLSTRSEVSLTLTCARFLQVVLHAATADDLRSVKSILKGLSQRDVLKEPAVYNHTSGCVAVRSFPLLFDSLLSSSLTHSIGVLTHPTQPDSVVFNDKAPEMINSLVADDAPHRKVDLFINEAVEGGKLNARISIVRYSPFSKEEIADMRG